MLPYPPQAIKTVSIHSYPAWGRRLICIQKTGLITNVSIHSYPAWGRRQAVGNHLPTYLMGFNPLLPRVG